MNLQTTVHWLKFQVQLYIYKLWLLPTQVQALDLNIKGKQKRLSKIISNEKQIYI